MPILSGHRVCFAFTTASTSIGSTGEQATWCTATKVDCTTCVSSLVSASRSRIAATIKKAILHLFSHLFEVSVLKRMRVRGVTGPGVGVVVVYRLSHGTFVASTTRTDGVDVDGDRPRRDRGNVEEGVDGGDDGGRRVVVSVTRHSAIDAIAT